MDKVENPIVQLNDVLYSWPATKEPVISIEKFDIVRGERVFLRGPSGSGKTTLLSLIAAVLTPQSGNIVVDGVVVNSLRGGQRDQFRVDRIGLVFQQFNLLPFMSVSDNIQLPCRFSKIRQLRVSKTGHTVAEETDRLLRAMQLSPTELEGRTVSQLSVGQQQRVAVARALIGSPPLIIADEPTSALDSDTRQAFLELLFIQAEASGCTVLFVSHDASLANAFDRQIDLREINKFAASQEFQGVAR